MAIKGQKFKRYHSRNEIRSDWTSYRGKVGNDRDAEAKHLICRVHRRFDGKYGYRQLRLSLLQDEGVWMDEP